MKPLLVLALIMVTIPAFNQVTLNLNKVDDFTGALTKTTNYSSDVFVYKGNDPKDVRSGATINFFIQREDSVYWFGLHFRFKFCCLSQYDGKVLIKLTNGTIIECLQVTNTDCSDYPSAMYIPLKREGEEFDITAFKRANVNWDKLSNTPIEQIRVYGSEYYQDFIPNPKFTEFPAQNILIEHLKALK